MFKIKPSVLIIFLGFIGMALSMTAKDISIFAKDILFMVCFFIATIGAILNTPLRSHFTEQVEFEGQKPEGWK